MKNVITRPFEPFWFGYAIVVSSAMLATNPVFKRHWTTWRKKHGCGFIKLCRYMSKRASNEWPSIMPVTLLVGAVIGTFASGIVGAITGAGLSYLFLMVIPFIAPLPSVLLENDSHLPNTRLF